MGYKVAIIGATGNVGREMMQTMVEREFPADEVVALASHRSAGKEVAYGDDERLIVQDLETFDFTGTDIVLSSPGASVSAKFSPIAVEAGAVVVDNTSHFRMDPDVPLVIPEVNPEAIAGYTKKGIIANPNCSTIQMLVALKPLHDMAKIKRVVVATYQSVSGGGKSAMDELFNQTRGVYMNQTTEQNREIFTKQIAFNVIPHIDKFMDDGTTKEEWKMVVETKKILDPSIEVCASCVRVPVFIGHAEMINIEFENPIDENEARDVLREAPGVAVVDHREDEGYVTPAECAGEDAVFVSRIRKDPTVENGLNLWCVSDNLRKGAALN
ncbi:MAG: aspartate-semialdehyde dehydrogenase, partial [Magnetovibrio sp.]|nr:aspartate-semialdehyde dehydrogenase [Magnetovibrio sp.]